MIGNSGKGIKNAMRKCIIYSLFFGVIACIFFIVFAPYCSSYFLHGKISNVPIYIMAISLPFNSLVSSLTGYFTGVRRVSKTSISKILSIIFQVFLTIYFLQTFPYKSLDTVCIYLIFSSTIAVIFEFVLTYILYITDRKKISNIDYISNDNFLRKILRIAFPVAITSYVRSGLSTLKQLLIPFSLEKHSANCEKALSEYGLINGMTMPILMFPCIIITSASSLLIPEFARYNIKKDFNKMNKVISFIFKFTSFFSICIIGIFLTFTEEICFLFYHNLEIAKFLVVLAPLVILIYLDKIIDAMLRGLDKQVGVMFCNIFDLFLTIILIYFLVPTYGIYGYLIIIAISEILNFTISLIQLYTVTKFKFDYVSYIIIPFLLVLASKYLFDAIYNYIEYNIYFILIKIFSFILLYVFLLILFNGYKFLKERKIFILKKCTSRY